MGNPPPLTNPWSWTVADGRGRPIRLMVTFNPTTRVITNIVTHRHPQCAFSRVLLGLGADNRPDSTTRVIDAAAGQVRLPPAQLAVLNGRGITTIEHLANNFQITAA